MLKTLRKLRRWMWRWQIILGDIIAIFSGRFIKRWFLKKALKKSGKELKKLTG